MLAATAITVIVSALVILVHFETMTLLTKFGRSHRMPTRLGLLLGVFALFAAHSLEVWIFAGGALCRAGGSGTRRFCRPVQR